MKVNINGFGIIDAMIAISILSTITLVVASQTKQVIAIDNTVKAESKKRVLKHKIETILTDEKNCNLNFSFNEHAKLTNNKIRFYDSGGNIQTFIDLEEEESSKRNFKITKMNISNTRYGNYSLNLHTSVRKSDNKHRNSGTIKIIILTKYDDGIKCSTSYRNQIVNLINTAVLKSCKAPFKIVKVKSKTSIYECIFPKNLLHNSSCPPGQVLNKVLLKNLKGQLTIKTECSPTNLCKLGEISMFINNKISCQKKCKLGEIPIITNKKLECKKINCPTGQFMRGINSDGQPICLDLVDKTTTSCKKNIKLVEQNNKIGVQCDQN